MKTTVLLDIVTMAFIGYLTFSDGSVWEIGLFFTLLVINIVKWITTPRKEH